MSVVFAKTPKGQEEMASRTGGLSPRVRRILILIDGQRSIDDLRDMVKADDLQHTLGLLEESGYIEMVQGTPLSTTPTDPDPVATKLKEIQTSFRSLPLETDPIRLQQARNFMTNTLTTFVGRIGTSSLLDRIETAPDHTRLRSLYDEWYLAIVMSRDGRREAEALRARLLRVI